MKGKVICDGRGNGGTGARAAVLILETGEQFEKAEKLDATTNIVAEHLAIQLGMELAVEHGVTDLVIWNDSLTPVNHILGAYQVKADHLKPLVDKTWDMRSSFERFAIERVPRAQTKLADALCRKIDPAI
jgi:ribonuclease HI